MMEIRQVEVEFEDLTYQIECNLDEAISRLQKVKARAEKEGFTSLRIDVDTVSDYGGGEYARVTLYAKRHETAEEALAREARDAAQKASNEARERAQFEALKAKFG